MDSKAIEHALIEMGGYTAAFTESRGRTEWSRQFKIRNLERLKDTQLFTEFASRYN